MKFAINLPNVSDKQNKFLIEIKNSLDLCTLARGDSFVVYIYENNLKTECNVTLLADGKNFLIGEHVVRFQKKCVLLKKDNMRFWLAQNGLVKPLSLAVQCQRPVEPKKIVASASSLIVKAPLTGKIIGIAVEVGQKVTEGTLLMMIEAMKMENRILAERDGKIKTIAVTQGQNVNIGNTLLIFTEDF